MSLDLGTEVLVAGDSHATVRPDRKVVFARRLWVVSYLFNRKGNSNSVSVTKRTFFFPPISHARFFSKLSKTVQPTCFTIKD